MQEVARQLGRAASTISRELRRNAATRSGGLEYRATTAQWHAERAARRPKQAKLARSAALRTYVDERLAGVVVNHRPNIDRREYDRLRAIVHNAARHGPASQNRSGHPHFRDHLLGRISWVAHLNPARGERLMADFEGIDWS